ncbi:type II secretion system protein [Shewanella marina]|uniref:type II secretion system protein n=1 Tax=Shewanella marina TaxID=487319 RepID=UPI000686A323|nr:type II secretion system protein [Shewanella marina]
MNKIKKEKGFTLIELVVVIIILGVLAITAASKLIDVEQDAKLAVIKQIEADLHSTIEQLHMLAEIQNKLTGNAVVQTDYGPHQFWNGYPENYSEATPQMGFLTRFYDFGPLQKQEERYKYYANDIVTYESNNLSAIGISQTALFEDKCYVEYRHTGTGQSIKSITEGC